MLFKTKTVDAILAKIKTVIAELEAHEVEKNYEIGELQETIFNAETDMEAARIEAAKAARVLTKMKELIA